MLAQSALAADVAAVHQADLFIRAAAQRSTPATTPSPAVTLVTGSVVIFAVLLIAFLVLEPNAIIPALV